MHRMTLGPEASVSEPGPGVEQDSYSGRLTEDFQSTDQEDLGGQPAGDVQDEPLRKGSDQLRNPESEGQAYEPANDAEQGRFDQELKQDLLSRRPDRLP